MKQRLCICVCLFVGACGSDDVVYDGSLDPSDERLGFDGSAYDWFKVELEAGESLVATVKSEQFEPTLFLFNADHRQIREQPGSQGLCILNYQAGAPGTYSIMVNGLEATSTGAYQLTVHIDEP